MIPGYSLIKCVNFKVTWSHMHTFCDGRPYLRVIGTGYLTMYPKFGVSLTFGSAVIVCPGNTAMWNLYVLLDATPCCFSEATLSEFPQHWEAPRPCCCMPHFCCHSCLNCCEVSSNVNQVLSSYNRQWILLYFSVDASNSFLGQQDIKLYLKNHATYICINTKHTPLCESWRHPH